MRFIWTLVRPNGKQTRLSSYASYILHRAAWSATSCLYAHTIVKCGLEINLHVRFLSCCTYLKWFGRSDCKLWSLPRCNYISHAVKWHLIATQLQDVIVAHFNARRTRGQGLFLSRLCVDVTTHRHRPRRSCWGLGWLSCWTLKHCTIGLCWWLCTWIAERQ